MNSSKKVVVTGGAGYIGSHAVVSLIENGFEPIIIDNLINSDLSVIKKIEHITNKKIEFFNIDLREKQKLIDIFNANDIDSVMHFAGLKSVKDSVHNSLKYYSNNILGSMSLFEAMDLCEIKKLVFSSSATVYGEPVYLPLNEKHPLDPISPYGRSKLYIESILSDLCYGSNDWSVVCLRYFNPIGAHKSGVIGENPKGIPENIMPFILKVVSGELDLLEIFGNDYDTPDGSCLRDYIHIEDLVEAHVKSLSFLSRDGLKKFNIFNVGTGKPISVIELVEAFEKASKVKINRKFSDRRKGDVSSCYADIELSKKKLEWKAKRSLDSMCESAWKYVNVTNLNNYE